jgi:ribosomal subunit interface protein
MLFRVSGKNLDIGESLQDHARERIAAVLGKYFDGEATGHVTVQPEGSGFRADMILHLATGITLQAEGRGHDAYATFDQAAERIEKRLRRHKGRLKIRHTATNQGGAERADGQAAAPDMALNYVIETPADEDIHQDFNPVVVAEAKTPLKRLSVSAAVLELDMCGAPLLVFRHATTTEVNIVYRRPDGHIGWIDPSAGSEGSRS